jgi:hypothetical protein
MNVAGELYGRARLEDLLGRLAAAATVAEIGEAIRADVSRFTAGAEPSDDLTILIIRWNGPRGAQPHSEPVKQSSAARSAAVDRLTR